jgi:hypothetical protein
MVGGGDAYRPAESCSVASEKYGNGEYMAHQGPSDSFLVAEAKVKDGSARVRIALWRCSFCGAVLVGLGDPEEDVQEQEYAWFERAGGG